MSEYNWDVSDYEAEMQDRWEPQATMADAHREWHLNSGVPLGQPGCPQDACHPIDEEWCCESFVEGTLGLHDHDCPEADGAPIHQWQVTTLPEIDPWEDFPF